LTHVSFALLVTATILIAAAGYAINDYFDLRADRINKPEKIILGKSISRRSAILYHSLFNIIALLIGIYICAVTGLWPFIFIFIVIPGLLWMSSIRYKKKFFIGNFIVAVMAAFVVAIVWMFDFHSLTVPIETSRPAVAAINNYVRTYALFAFLITLLREIVKDVEDIKGDSKTGCKTIPIASGITVTRRIIVFIILLVIFLALYIQVYLINRDFDLLFAYIILAVQLPLIFMINKTINAIEKQDYSSLSRLSKFIMFSGVLAMLVVYFYIKEGFSIVQ